MLHRGILPFRVWQHFERMKEFAATDPGKFIAAAGTLAHYVGDASQPLHGSTMSDGANCVVVGGTRAGEERVAACVVRADTRADVNNVVRRLIDVRKASFLSMDQAVAESGMEYGGITPLGLPAAWRLLVDSRTLDIELAVVGSGIRRSKLLLPGRLLGLLPRAEVHEGLAR